MTVSRVSRLRTRFFNSSFIIRFAIRERCCNLSRFIGRDFDFVFSSYFDPPQRDIRAYITYIYACKQFINDFAFRFEGN